MDKNLKFSRGAIVIGGFGVVISIINLIYSYVNKMDLGLWWVILISNIIILVSNMFLYKKVKK